MIKKILASAVLLLPIFLFAQNEDDALRYSTFNTIGTARFASMGGAMGALGADFSALSTNPASIGLYRRTEITFTPNFYLDNTSNTYYNRKFSAAPRFNFNFANLGVVITSVNEDLEGRLRGRRLSTRERKRVRGWMASSFAIGLNRQMGFQQNFELRGVNTRSSIADMFAANSQGTDISLLGLNEFLAWRYYLTDTINNSPTQYTSYIPNAGTEQRLVNRNKGSISELIFSYGANYNHKWYFGGTLGIPRIRYTQQSTYYETDPLDTISAVENNGGFDSLIFKRDVAVKGSGINLKLGVIFRPSDKVRIGLAIHTPSYLRITQNYELSMATRFGAGYFAPTPYGGQVSYNLLTPMHAIGSAAFVLGKKGLVSVEYELIPYNMSRISASDIDFSAENEAIKNKYTLTGNAKLGGEYRVSDKVALRGGFTYFGNPFKNTLVNKLTAFNVSAGLGYRVDGFFADFAYVVGYRSQKYFPYDSSFTDPSISVTLTNNLLVTLGFRF